MVAPLHETCGVKASATNELSQTTDWANILTNFLLQLFVNYLCKIYSVVCTYLSHAKKCKFYEIHQQHRCKLPNVPVVVLFKYCWLVVRVVLLGLVANLPVEQSLQQIPKQPTKQNQLKSL